MEMFNKAIMKQLLENTPATYGKKRQCGNCSVKFFDLNKNDIVCPSCGGKFDPDFFNKLKRGKKGLAKDSVKVKKVDNDVPIDSEEEDFFLSDINK